MADFNSDFDGVEDAESSGNKLPFIEPGEYKLQVDKLVYFQSKQSSDRFTVGEFTVLESKGESANPVGARIKHMIKMGLPNSKGNVKSLFSAVIGEPKPTKETIQEAISPDQPCKGQIVKAYAEGIITKKDKPFTVVEYSR